VRLQVLRRRVVNYDRLLILLNHGVNEAFLILLIMLNQDVLGVAFQLRGTAILIVEAGMMVVTLRAL
jgi:hypothetical protein